MVIGTTMTSNGPNFGHSNRRNVLQSLGAAGAGIGVGSAIFGTSVAADENPGEQADDLLEDVWDGIVDHAYDQLSSGITPWDDRIDREELEEISEDTKSEYDLEEDGEVTPESLADTFLNLVGDVPNPTDTPFDICGEQDLVFDGDRVCISSGNIFDSEIDECPSTLPIYGANFGFTLYEKGVTGDWEVTYDLEPWVGVNQNGCLFAGIDHWPIITECALIDCPGDYINPVTAGISTLVDVAVDIASNALDQLSIDLPTILDWVLLAIFAAAIIALLVAAAIAVGGSGGTALVPAVAVAAAVGGSLGSAWA